MHQETSKKQKAIKLLGLFASFSLLSFIYAIFQVTFLFVLLVARLITEEGVFELSFHFPELKVNDELISFWDIPEFYISLVIASFLMIWISMGVIALIVNKNPVNYIGLRRFRKSDYKWIVFSVVFIGIYGLILFFLDLDFRPDFTFSNHLQIGFAFLSMALYVPLLEEIIFRGYLLTRLNEIFGNKLQLLSVIIVSVIFAFSHIYYPMSALVFIFFMSVFLCVMKLKTGNLWLAVIFHMINNLLAVYFWI